MIEKKTENKNVKNIVKLTLTMNDVPLALYKEFVSDIYRYNDMYWVKLQDVMRKAEAYDLLMSTEAIPDYEQEEIEPSDLNDLVKDNEKTPKIKTFGATY